MFYESPRHHSGSRRHSREGTRVFIHCLKKCNFEFFASELWNMFCIWYQFRENSRPCAHVLRNFQYSLTIRHFRDAKLCTGCVWSYKLSYEAEKTYTLAFMEIKGKWIQIYFHSSSLFLFPVIQILIGAKAIIYNIHPCGSSNIRSE